MFHSTNISLGVKFIETSQWPVLIVFYTAFLYNLIHINKRDFIDVRRVIQQTIFRIYVEKDKDTETLGFKFKFWRLVCLDVISIIIIGAGKKCRVQFLLNSASFTQCFVKSHGYPATGYIVVKTDLLPWDSNQSR